MSFQVCTEKNAKYKEERKHKKYINRAYYQRLFYNWDKWTNYCELMDLYCFSSSS